ncbi:MAG: FtsX-like permease family protein [Polyangiaceae bacterium]
MGYPLSLAFRYLGSRKRASISVGTFFAIIGVALGVAALATVMSVTGGFQDQFRDKVLGVNAHVLVLKYSNEFRDYRYVMDKVRAVPGVVAVAPFSINPMMLTHEETTATGVLLKGVDPRDSLGVGADPGVPPVLDLPRHIIEGPSGKCAVGGDLQCGIEQLKGLRRPTAKPGQRHSSGFDDPLPTPSPRDSAAPLDSGLFDPPPAPSGSAEAAPSASAAPKGSAAAKGSAAPKASSAPNAPLAPHSKNDSKGGFEEGTAAGEDPNKPPAPRPTASATPTASAKAGPGKPKTPPIDNVPGDPEPAPTGEKKPYSSVLPDDDEIEGPAEYNSCKDPEKVKAMPGIIVGVSLAKTLDLAIGACVTVTSPTIGYQMSGGAVRPPVAKSFRVMAIFEAGFDQYDSKLVYTDLYEAQTFYDQGDTVTGVEMKIADIDKADDVVEGVKVALDSSSYHIMDWKELNHGLFTALLIQKIGMSAVLALIILVAAFTVVATLIMVVLDKKKEIAVLKAMGATDWGILRVFLYQGGIIGTLGTGLGLGLGLGACKILIRWAFPLDPKVYFISHLPVVIRTQEFVFTGCVSVALCLLATIIPSLYAASLRPADGFREQ